MKSLRILSVLLVVQMTAFSQQKPHYTQYILNNYILNPALSGIENYVDIKVSHRHQWVGLQDAPVTTYLTINAPLKKQDDKTNVTTLFRPAEETGLRGKDMLEQYEASAPHHGVGFQLINDNTGPFNNLSAFATYAYHVGLSRTTNLSAGLGLGVSKLSLNASKLNFGSTSPFDPAVYKSDELGKARMDLNAGLWLYSYKYFIGLAANQLLPHTLDFSGDLLNVTHGKLVPHMFATAGYRILVGEDIDIIPSVMVKSIGSIPLQIDVNAKAQFNGMFWVGGSYRAKYGFAGMAGMNLMNKVAVSYAYDYSTTKINTVSKGTHEILIGFLINYTKESCPRNIW